MKEDSTSGAQLTLREGKDEHSIFISSALKAERDTYREPDL